MTYTGHAHCRKCGSCHWMHGPCPPKNTMRSNSYYDDDLNNPKPPPWWQGPLVAAVFFAAMTALCLFCASCTCTLDGESVARAIIIYEAGK